MGAFRKPLGDARSKHSRCSRRLLTVPRPAHAGLERGKAASTMGRGRLSPGSPLKPLSGCGRALLPRDQRGCDRGYRDLPSGHAYGKVHLLGAHERACARGCARAHGHGCARGCAAFLRVNAHECGCACAHARVHGCARDRLAWCASLVAQVLVVTASPYIFTIRRPPSKVNTVISLFIV